MHRKVSVLHWDPLHVSTLHNAAFYFWLMAQRNTGIIQQAFKKKFAAERRRLSCSSGYILHTFHGASKDRCLIWMANSVAKYTLRAGVCACARVREAAVHMTMAALLDGRVRCMSRACFSPLVSLNGQSLCPSTGSFSQSLIPSWQ